MTITSVDLERALLRAARASHGDSNDAEIAHLSDALDEALTLLNLNHLRTAAREQADAEAERAERDVPTDWSMFTPEGNAEVTAAAHRVLERVGEARNRATLAVIAREEYDKIQADESSDTEPRGCFGDFLDRICEQQGWAYASYEGYDL